MYFRCCETRGKQSIGDGGGEGDQKDENEDKGILKLHGTVYR